MSDLTPYPENVPIPAPQAGSDAALLDLWLRVYRSAETRRAYRGDLAAFCAFVDRPLRIVKLGDVQAFAASIEHQASASAARRLSAVKSLFKFGHRIGYLTFDVAAPIQLPAIQDRLSERILSEWDVQQLLGRETRPRNTALLRLIYGAGLRISEAVGLRWRDLTPRDDAGQIAVFGKGGKTRIVLLPRALYARLSEMRVGADDDAPVFRGRRGRSLCVRQAHAIVKSAAKRAGLSPKISAHYLRHSHCSHALDRGAPVHVVQQTLGHASLTTTTRYSHARPGDSSARYLAA